MTSDEEARLRELDRLAILDSVEERAYDDITRYAAQMAGAPIALISLVDGTRQWFKARTGLQVRETPRELAFCSVALQNPDRPLIVRDTLEDARFASNALVTGDPNIRFYAGAPLVTSSGHALGTVCVIDRQPRDLSQQQLDELQFLAQQVVRMLEERRDGVAPSSVGPSGQPEGGIRVG